MEKVDIDRCGMGSGHCCQSSSHCWGISLVAEIDGFVLFDPTNRYKVDLPNGWPEAVKRAKEAKEPRKRIGSDVQ